MVRRVRQVDKGIRGRPAGGDSSKAQKTLGWKPEGDFTGLVRVMVEADMARLSRVPGTPAGVETR